MLSKRYKKYGWANSLPEIPESEITETIYTDVVVCGAGFAGCSTACRSSENGLDVVVLEKGPTYSARGLHLGVADSKVMRSYGIKNNLEDLAVEWVHFSASRADERLINLFLHRSGEAMDWLLEKCDKHGITYDLYAGQYNGRSYKEYFGTHTFSVGVFGVVKMLLDEAVENGAQVFFNTPVVNLVKDGEKVVGVIAGSDGHYRKYMASCGVVLATGGICGNKDMCEDLCPEALMGNNVLNEVAYQDTGDGHIMGINAGGIMQRAPFPCTVHSMAYTLFYFQHIIVDQEGRRFKNEDVWPQGLTMAMYERCPERPWAYSIMDANWPKQVNDTVDIAGGMYADSVYRRVGEDFNINMVVDTIETEIIDGKYAVRADTLEELAEKIRVPKEQFMKTIARYNELCRNGEDVDFGKRRELMFPLEQGPFTALRVGGSLMVVMGGLLIDDNMRVVDEDYYPIEGLYAVGNASGGLYAVDYPLVIPGNSHGRCLTWGYLAGNHLASRKIKTNA